MITFLPDLIIEATNLCNKKCKGCYASNLVSTKSSLEIQKSQPELFLKTIDIESCIKRMNLMSKIKVSIRGGEPSLHPQISELIRTASKYSSELYLETHGNWIINSSSNEQYLSLLQALSETRAIVKISFDSMHGTNINALREMTAILDIENISYKIAITEYSFDEFLNQRKSVEWIDDFNIIYQKKVINYDELIKPIYGVIKTSGELHKSLNSKLSNDKYQEVSA